ncbi:MAG: helix-turn-helix domain-containing protein [Candidatus Diapherotrites archaeon]|nr:helix-turn-helix domain-containing protein [Candidatus Diapherotrites archaeon]
MREVLLLKTIALLKEKGFTVESFIHSNSCFDIAAKRGKLVLAIKVLNNIDSLREEQCSELKKVAVLFNAIAIIVGEKSKAFFLRDSAVYERYSANVVSFGGLANLLEENFPSSWYFKGKEIAELDSEKMRERRKELGLTLEDIANKINSTTESIYRYEKGAKISLQKAEALEDVLDAPLIKKINILEGQEKKQDKIGEEDIEDSALEKIHDLGANVFVFRHAPFKASAVKKESIIIGKGTGKQGIKKKAIELVQARHVFEAGPVIIAKDFRAKKIGSVPIIEEQELNTMSRFNELKELIKERAEENG